MPSSQEILSDPKFQSLPIGEQLKVMRTVDPGFAALPPKDQGTVIAKTRQKSLGYDKIGLEPKDAKTGFVGRIAGDIKSVPQTVGAISDVINPLASAKAKGSGLATLAGPNLAEYRKSQDKGKSKTERFGHGLASLMPGVGPMAARAGEDIGSGDLGAAGADILELAGPKIAEEVSPGVGTFAKGFREGWDEAGIKSVSARRGANTAWRKLPEPSTPPPRPVDPIPSQLPSGRKVPVPGSKSTVDTPSTGEAEKSAAELMKSVGIGPDEVLKATPEQWKMIEQQVGESFDKQKAIEHLRQISKEPAKPSPNGSLPTPKTPRPSPGGEKVESTVTPEARAARANDHATKLAQKIRKTLPSDKIPEPGNDAAWKVLEDQTGTEATPAVRKSAIEKARKLWSEGPRSAGDLQKRRSDFFANKSKE